MKATNFNIKKLKNHFQNVNDYTNQLIQLQTGITPKERFNIAKFKIGLMMLELTNFSDDSSIASLLDLSEEIMDFKYSE